MLDHMLSWIFIVLVHIESNPHVVSPWGGGHIIMIQKQPISRSLLNTENNTWFCLIGIEYRYSDVIWSIQKEITT